MSKLWKRRWEEVQKRIGGRVTRKVRGEELQNWGDKLKESSYKVWNNMKGRKIN